MSYNNENYYALREEFERKRKRNEEQAEKRQKELAEKVEGIAELDAVLADTARRIMGAAMAGREGLDARIAKIRRETEDLRSARADLLRANGYPADYSDVKYECELCGDTGFVDGKMCSCFRRALTLRAFCADAGPVRFAPSRSGKIAAGRIFCAFFLLFCRHSGNILFCD